MTDPQQVGEALHQAHTAKTYSTVSGPPPGAITGAIIAPPVALCQICNRPKKAKHPADPVCCCAGVQPYVKLVPTHPANQSNAPSGQQWYRRQDVDDKLAELERLRAEIEGRAAPAAYLPSADADYPDPTPADLEEPLFLAVWEAIKKWDISRNPANQGYAGASGNDVMHILIGMAPLIASEKTRSEAYKRALETLGAPLDMLDEESLQAWAVTERDAKKAW
jgi:hypothetical protein